MEDVKQENQVIQEKVNSEINETNVDIDSINKSLNKLIEDNKVLKQEIIKLKNQPQENKIEEKPYEIDKEL